MKQAIFGGGCFWCTEAMFLQLQGVERVESGYSGGNLKNPSYKEVCTGSTGHAEVVRVTYLETDISFRELLQIHLASHDPTTLNRQGNDVGTQYRSIVFYQSEEEKKIAKEVVEEFQFMYDHKVTTQIVPFEVFYIAEQDHQNYFELSGSSNSYCQIVIDPKVKKFKEKFSKKLKKQ